MSIDPVKHAENARKNGARSKGPKSDAGKERCRQAAATAAHRRAVAVTFDCTLLPTESRETLESITVQELAYWQPSTPNELQMVKELIDINWRIQRIRFSQTNSLLSNMEAQRQRAAAPELSSSMVAQAEVEGSVPGGAQITLDRRAGILAASRSRIIRDLDSLAKRFPSRGGSQPPLQTEHLPAELSWRVPAVAIKREQIETFTYPAEPATLVVDPPKETKKTEPEGILHWAKQNIGFDPDPHQIALMTTESKDVLMLGGRQTGKSTAAAVRVVHEAVNNAGSTILLAGPTGRQSGQIMVKSRQIAKRLGLTLSAPPPGCDGFKLPNGSNITSLPDSEQTIRGFSAPRLIVVDEAAYASDELISALKPMLAVSNGRMMLLSTPNGQSGYFYEKWHEENGPWQKILCKASDCARINAEMLENMRRTMSKEDFNREFNCEFVAAPGQGVARELFRRSIRADIKPMFEDED
ncbi:MAG: terminase large subunit domain-containing protein [Bryobacteraceae bacterium]